MQLKLPAIRGLNRRLPGLEAADSPHENLSGKEAALAVPLSRA
jgi:hypothetical protein